MLWIRGAVRLVFAAAFIGVPLFWGAGTLDWGRGSSAGVTVTCT